MKLNLGCGSHWLPGYVNVDKEAVASRQLGLQNSDWHFHQHDLERFPWPWKDNQVEEVVMSHVLEHLGRDPDVFIGIFRELYRVCAHDARVKIAVPHPRHDHFLGDPTHVRPITPEVLSLFSRKNCEQWARIGAANTPLALYHGVDFEIEEKAITLEPRYKRAFENGDLTALQLDMALMERNNVATEIRMTLRVVKDRP